MHPLTVPGASGEAEGPGSSPPESCTINAGAARHAYKGCNSRLAKQALGSRQGPLAANSTCDLTEACPSSRSFLRGKTDSTVWNISKHKKHRSLPSLLGLPLRASYPTRGCKDTGPNRIPAATCATTRPASDTPSWLNPVARGTPTLVAQAPEGPHLRNAFGRNHPEAGRHSEPRPIVLT